MKTFVVSLMIAAVIITGSICYDIYLKHITKDMNNFNQEIIQAISDDNYEEAEQAIQRLFSFIDEKKIALASTMDHSSIDNIEKNLAELDAYVLGNQKIDALAKCQIMHVLFDHFPKNYTLKLENIL